MSIMNWTKDETVAIITLTNGENRQNLVFSKTLNAMLDEIIADKTITALIITSDDAKNFSQGIDVTWIMGQLEKMIISPLMTSLMRWIMYLKTSSLSGAGHCGDQRPCFRQRFDINLCLRFSLYAFR